MYLYDIISEDMPEVSPGAIHKSLQYKPSSTGGLLSMKDYTGNSRKINNWLHNRFRGKETKNVPGLLKSVDKEFIQQPPLAKPIKVFTGIPESPSRLWKLHRANTNSPVRAHLPAFTSTTTNYGVAKHFAEWEDVDIKNHMPHEIINGTLKALLNDPYGRHVLYIVVPAGYSAVSVKSISYWRNESEIILPRGLDIMINPHPIVKFENRDVKTYIWGAKVIGHNPIQIIT